jgi:hypothetical protein
LENQAACLRDPANGCGSGLAIRAHLRGSLRLLSCALEVAEQQSLVNAHDGPPRVNRRVVVNIINKSLGRVRKMLD